MGRMQMADCVNGSQRESSTPYCSKSFFICFLISVFVSSALALEILEVYKDPTKDVETRIQDLLSRMTLEEKIGQMTQIERTVANSGVVQRYFIGSVLNGGGSVPDPNTPTSWQDMVDGFQAQALSTRLAIPMIYGVDAVHGHNNVYGATIFPHNVGLGCARDPHLMRKIGSATALEVRATGIPYVFAPCIAVCQDPRWGRCYESYSESTEVVRNMSEFIFGLQGEPANKSGAVPFVAGKSKVAACAKHYVGDGGTRRGINANNTKVSYKRLVQTHMAPYFDAVAKGVSTVMISYSSWNGIKMHANKFLITKVLKRQLGFKGFVISDMEGIDFITSPKDKNYTFSVLAGVNSGIDMVMVPFDYSGFISNLTALVKSGDIKMGRINDAVTRILRVKLSMGLFEEPYADRSFTYQLGSHSHRKLARKAVRKSLVLLKNGKEPNQPLLPLSKDAKKILVAGSHADDLGLQCGGWTMSWQGSNGSTTIGTTILSAIKRTVSQSSQVIYERNPAPGFTACQKADYAIVVVGEPAYAEGRGDSLNLSLPLEGIATIKNVCGELKCLVVLISGRPLAIKSYVPLMDALVAAWLPGSEGLGITDVVFGDHEFKGKTSRTWFKSVEQLPMNVGDEHYDPLFQFGFGMTMGVKNMSSKYSL